MPLSIAMTLSVPLSFTTAFISRTHRFILSFCVARMSFHHIVFRISAIADDNLSSFSAFVFGILHFMRIEMQVRFCLIDHYLIY